MSIPENPKWRQVKIGLVLDNLEMDLQKCATDISHLKDIIEEEIKRLEMQRN